MFLLKIIQMLSYIVLGKEHLNSASNDLMKTAINFISNSKENTVTLFPSELFF